jgi:CO/xanthine dehydrogenase Mo-binding subunit
MTSSKPLADPQRPNTYVGAPIERVEDLRFLRGRGCYLDDLSRPGQWHAAFVRSAVAHGTIRGVDTSAALSMRGVRAVITAADIAARLALLPTIPSGRTRRSRPTRSPSSPAR